MLTDKHPEGGLSYVSLMLFPLHVTKIRLPERVPHRASRAKGYSISRRCQPRIRHGFYLG
ncbi:hypothetical protein GCM10011389_40680 [Pontibacillus salipaludis]|uniref:Uncharacterized protein n=1 Tax=Pontibacillus salipaludis TaxID=1697394 RepID=A0ABQ1QIK4_9BACI|nr:hypothetical protein GCM10011389_40680 [Pontibacillus salipaludis]